MLAEDIVQPSKSAWSSPVILMPKKDGTHRFYVDYRQLNAVSKKDAYPIPYVSAILDRSQGAKYLSLIDIHSAYWQVPLNPSSRELTAFTVPGRGLYHFKRMPFGLINTPALPFSDSSTQFLEPIWNHSLILENVEILGMVFDRLLAAGLTVSREKCKFCRPSLTYLGYVVDREGLRVDPSKVEAILCCKPSFTNISFRRNMHR